MGILPQDEKFPRRGEMSFAKRANLYGQLLSNYFSYYFGTGRPVLNGYLIVALTYACNSRCVMCNIWKRYNDHPDERKKELSCDEWLKCLSETRLLKHVPKLNITGGEPFLKPGIRDFIRGLFALGDIQFISIVTNGFMPEKELADITYILEGIPKTKRLFIGVSMDGYGKAHDEMRGVANGFEKAIQTLDGLLDLKKKYSQLETGAGAVIHPKNIDQLEELEAFLKERNLPTGYEFNMENFNLNNEGAAEGFTGNHMRKINAIIDREIEQRDCFLGARKWLSTGKRPLKCFAGYNTAFIDPFGDVYPCISISNNKKFLMGNVRDKKLDDLWTSKKAWEVRGKNVKKCPYAFCWSGCEVEPSIVQNLLPEKRKLMSLFTGGRVDYYKKKGFL